MPSVRVREARVGSLPCFECAHDPSHERGAPFGSCAIHVVLRKVLTLYGSPRHRAHQSFDHAPRRIAKDERAGSGRLNRFPRTISGVLPGFRHLPHRGWDGGRA